MQGEPCEGSNSQGGGLAEEEENEKRKKTDIGLETLSQYFHLTQAEACKALGLGGTSLKKVCRRLGIERWPHRKVSDPLGHARLGLITRYLTLLGLQHPNHTLPCQSCYQQIKKRSCSLHPFTKDCRNNI